MAISTVADTHGLLSAWAEHMEVSPWGFNQVTGNGIDALLTNKSAKFFVQPERDNVARALAQAIEQGVKVARFYPRPAWLSCQIPVDPRRYITRQRLTTEYGYIKAIGKRAVTLIEAGATVTYSDTNGDGVDDLATISVTTSITAADEIQVFFRAADSLASAADERWRIEPLRVTVSGGTATITGHRALFVKPSVWRVPYTPPAYSDASKNSASPQNAADFVTAVDIYRVYADPTSAVMLGDTAIEAEIVNSKLGFINIGTGDNDPSTTTERFVTVWYQAGYPLDTYTNDTDQRLKTAYARLANTLFAHKPTNGDVRTMTYDNDDAARAEGFLPTSVWNNDLHEVKTGAIEAWKTFNAMALSYPIEAV